MRGVGFWALLFLILTDAFRVVAAPKLWAAESAPGSLKACVGGNAREELQARAPVLELLGDPHQLPLPPDFIEALRKHPISHWAQKYRDKKLVVDSPNYFWNSGEGIQGRFAIKVLRELFGSVEVKAWEDMTLDELRAISKSDGLFEYFVSRIPRLRAELRALPDYLKQPRSLTRPTYLLISIGILDSAETYPIKRSLRESQDENGRNFGDLDMPILKPANPTFSGIDRQEVRDLFGIAPTTQVVSIYTLNLNDRAILEALPKSRLPGVIFYSDSKSQDFKKLSLFLDPWTQSNGYRVVGLSQLRKGDLRITQGERHLVINDKRGVMPYQHAAADLAIIRGPINIFESLSVGTPTAIIPDRVYSDEKSSGYHPKTFEEMLGTALRTGGASVVSDIVSDQAMAGRVFAETMAKGRNFTRPHLLAGPDGKTPVDRFLNHLQQVMEELGL